MAIVTYDQYTNTYYGETIAAADFTRADAHAERVINQITRGAVTEYESLPAFQKNALVEAVCAQISYFALNGVDIAVNGNTANGWTVGKVRIDSGSSGSASGATSIICAGAIAALEQTGLLNRQVDTVGDPSILPWYWGY